MLNDSVVGDGVWPEFTTQQLIRITKRGSLLDLQLNLSAQPYPFTNRKPFLPAQILPVTLSSSFARRAIGSLKDFINLRAGKVAGSHPRADSLILVTFCAQF